MEGRVMGDALALVFCFQDALHLLHGSQGKVLLQSTPVLDLDKDFR